MLIIEHPKCGRIWLYNILKEIEGLAPSISHAGSAAINRKDNIDHISPDDYINSKNVHNVEKWAKWHNSQQKVFLYRDPRDVMTSFYFWVKNRVRKNKIDVKCAVDIPTFLRSIYGIEYLLKFYQMWGEYKAVMYLSYEEMSIDTYSSIISVLKFIGHRIDKAEIIDAIEMNSFENMRKMELKKNPRQSEDKPERLHVRKGIVGDHVNHMSTEDIEYCNKMMEKYPSRFLNG